MVETLLGRPPPPINSLSVSEYGTETVWLVAREQSSFWKSIDVDSCEPKAGTCRTKSPSNNLSNNVTGPRPQPLSLAGISFGYAARYSLILQTETLKEHRQAFVYSEEGLLSLPLLPEVARFFEGQVACSSVVFYIFTCVPDRPLVRTSATAMSLFSFYTSCKVNRDQRAISNFCTSGKLSVSPDQATFNVREEFTRLV